MKQITPDSSDLSSWVNSSIYLMLFQTPMLFIVVRIELVVLRITFDGYSFMITLFEFQSSLKCTVLSQTTSLKAS